MPIFEYKCNDCSKVFEVLQLPGQDNEPECANCGSRNLKKLISAPFLPSSVGKPAGDDSRCSGKSETEECPAADRCTPGSCCGQNLH
ncbi:MAG TPA: zinc ribbon domain-containing protein [Bacillota bacterium]|nr:zinc ribbon domain-containing protein [Bacillota bacterium]